MTDPSESIDANAVRSRLPDGWTVDVDGDRLIFGYATDHELDEFPDPGAIPASFGIRREDELWTAVWLEADESQGGRHYLVDQATGVKERCIEWVGEKADGLDGHPIE